MVLWPRDQLSVAFDRIRKNAAAGGTTVLLLVAGDPDSLCACRILTSLFRVELISYSLVPVCNYKELKASVEERLQSSLELRSVIFVNCGAMIDLRKFVGLPEDLLCFVIDSHRPVHLANVHDKKQIIVIDDGILKVGKDIPSDYDSEDDNLMGSDDDEADGSGSDSEDEKGAEMGDPLEDSDEDGSEKEFEPERSRSRDNETGQEASDGPEDQENQMGLRNTDERSTNIEGDAEGSTRHTDSVDKPVGGGGESLPAEARVKDKASEEEDILEPEDGEEPSVKRRRLRRGDKTTSLKKRRRQIREYYSGNFLGSPSSCLMYELSQQLNRDTNNYLWMAIVGLTSHYVTQHMDTDSYNSHVEVLQQEVIHKNSDSAATFVLEDGASVPTAENGKLHFELEYRLMLYRHWSLYESMYHSNYVAAKLEIWRAAGRTKLETMLARMGLSLRECQQKFTFMSSDLRSKLRLKLSEASEAYGLTELFYGSFRRTYGFKQSLSASDAAYALSSLLRASAKLLSRYSSSEDGANSGNGPDAPDGPQFTSKDRWFLAYSATSSKNTNTDLLGDGIQESMRLQQAVVRQAVSIMEKRSITRAKHFRYAILQVVADEDERIFSYPATLSSLALFLIDVHRESKRWIGKQALPLVLLSLNEKTGAYTAVATMCPENYGDVVKNKFGIAFALAAEEIDAPSVNEGFETAVITIPKDDIFRFIESLHNTLDA